MLVGHLGRHLGLKDLPQGKKGRSLYVGLSILVDPPRPDSFHVVQVVPPRSMKWIQVMG